MKIKTKIFTITWLTILLASCDPGLVNNYVVDNKSDYVIEVSFRLSSGYSRFNAGDTLQTVKILPQSTVEIIEYGEIGTAHDKKQHFLEAFDTIAFRSIGFPVIKDTKNRNIWKYKVISEGLFSIDEVEYRLVLNNKDIKN